MAKHAATLERVKGFRQHGVRFRIVSAKQARGSCPICRTSSKDPFDVRADKLLWVCHRCGEKGSFPDFLALRMIEYQKEFKGPMVEILAENRKLRESTLSALGIGWDPESKLYMVPFFKGNRCMDIQRYSLKTGKPFNTSGGQRGYLALGGPSEAKTVYVVEGPWDSASLWEGLGAAVVGIKGALSGQGSGLVDFCQGKHVVLCYDHDNTGLEADTKSRELLKGRVKSIQSVHWPSDKKKGYDVRDLWIESKHSTKTFRETLKKYTKTATRPKAKSRVVTDTPIGAEPEQVDVPQEELTGKGLSRDDAVKGITKWLSLSDLDVIDILYGTLLGNRLEGSPIWLFLVGPSGCGKSELILSLEGVPCVFSISTLTPPALMSGKNSDDGKDPSIIPQLNLKVLSIKDFTPILSLPEKDQQLIFSVLRDAYDGKIEKPYGNGVFRKYDSIFGILAGTTSKIDEELSSHSVVGQRFIKFRMREARKLSAGEDAIRMAVDKKVDGKTSRMKADLRAISAQVLDRPVLPKHRPTMSKMFREHIIRLAQWCGNMRGGTNINPYTQRHKHMPAIEIATRLSEELVGLAMGIAIFRRRKAVGIEEMNIITKVAKDSVPDIRQEIIRAMYVHKRDDWTKARELLDKLKLNDATIQSMLGEMVSLSLVEKRIGDRGGEEFRISTTIRRQMKPLNLYAPERAFRRIMEEG
jgi:energy-coupling factor transporter ATP-binding protein EcfA2